MKITRRPAHLGFSLVTAVAIVLGAGVSGAAAAPNGPGRSGDAHAEHGHPNPDAVRGHDEEGKRGKGHESHGNGHGYGHGDHHGAEEIVIIDEPKVEQPKVEQPKVEQPTVDESTIGRPNVNEPVVDQPALGQPNASDPVGANVPVGEVPVAANVSTSPLANQSKALDAVGEASESAAPVIALVEIRSANDVPDASTDSTLAVGESDGVILRFR